MKSKMIITDLDRTLLKNDKTLSQYTIDILKQCYKQDIKIVLATARPKRAVKKYLEQLDIDAVIVHNGAIIYIENKLYEYYGIESTIAKKTILTIVKQCPEINLSVEINDQLYANYDVSKTWEGLNATITDFTDLSNLPVEKIIVDFKSSKELFIVNQLLPESVYLEISEGKLGLIMTKKASKYNAIKALANYYGINIKEMIAFGDDLNDLVMLQSCGVGVAVSNAIAEVKDVANYICDSNDNDGVAKWIAKNILLSNL